MCATKCLWASILAILGSHVGWVWSFNFGNLRAKFRKSLGASIFGDKFGLGSGLSGFPGLARRPNLELRAAP